MKLDLLVPNARYDLVHGRPSAIEKDNDGSFIYRYNIEPENGVLDGETEEKQIGWQCREIRVWEKPDKAVLKKAVIRSVMDESAEFAIINSYNKHVLGIKEDANKVDEYKEYLQFSEDLGVMIATDLSNYNV